MNQPGIFILICIISYILPVYGESTGFTITPYVNEASLGSRIEILEDISGELDIEEILLPHISAEFRLSDQDEPGFGFTSSVYWIKLNVSNPQSTPADWLLEVAYPPLDYVTLYIPVDKNNFIVKRTGDQLPFDSREINYRNFIFPLSEKPQSARTFYLRIQSTSSMNFPLNFWRKEALISRIDLEQLLLGIYFGSVILMIFYNIFLYLGLKEKSFLYLVLFIISWGFAQFAINGLAFQYLWSEWIWWANKNVPFFIFGTLAASTQFCRSLLFTRSDLPRWDKLLKSGIIVFTAGMLLSLISDYSHSIRIASAFAVADIALLLAIGFLSLKKRPQAVFFLSAWGLFFLGALLFAFKSFGILPGNLLTNWGVQMGSFAMMLLLTIAVQDRLEQERKGKLKAQQDLLNAQEELVLSLRESERVLEQKVRDRTEEINNINVLLIERATELANINRIAEKASSSLRLDDILQYVCEELVRTFEVQSAGIGLLNDSKNKLKITAFYSPYQDDDNLTGTELLLSEYEASKMVIETKLPLIVEDARNDSRTRSLHDFLKKNEADDLLIIPILSRNEVIGTIGMPFISEDYEFDSNRLELARSIAFHIASSVENARLYAKIEKALDVAEQDLEIGRQIQSGFFPEYLPEAEGWDFAVHFKAARQVSGDFYDIFRLRNSDGIVITIADVCDKGVGAALFMVLFRTLIRSLSELRLNENNLQSEPLNIITSINNYITGTHNTSNMFASLFYGVLVPGTGMLYYINCGHDAPLIINSAGNIKAELSPTGPVAGMMPDIKFEQKVIRMEEGDILFGYTDGTSDARNSQHEMFGTDAIVKSISGEWISAYSMLFSLNSDLDRFTAKQNQYDDITQIAVRRKKGTEPDMHGICKPAAHNHLEELRSFVEQTAIHKGLPDATVYDFKLAAEEICSNIIKYGFSETSPGIIKIIFIFEPGKAVLHIKDSGKYFSPWQAKIPDTNAVLEDRETGGLGLYFIKKLFDRIDYSRTEDNFNMLTLQKDLV